MYSQVAAHKPPQRRFANRNEHDKRRFKSLPKELSKPIKTSLNGAQARWAMKHVAKRHTRDLQRRDEVCLLVFRLVFSLFVEQDLIELCLGQGSVRTGDGNDSVRKN